MTAQIKLRAVGLVGRAIRNKTLLRSDHCETCGMRSGAISGAGRLVKIQGHHEDYSQPLSVKWLCVDCHRKAHRRSVGPKTRLILHRFPKELDRAIEIEAAQRDITKSQLVVDAIREYLK